MPIKNKYKPIPIGAVFIDSKEEINSFHGDGDAIGVVIVPEIIYGRTSVKNVVRLIGVEDDRLTTEMLEEDNAPPTDMTVDAAHQLGLILIAAAKTIRAAELQKKFKGTSQVG